MTSVPYNYNNHGSMVAGGSMLGPGGGNLSSMFSIPAEWYRNQNLYPSNYHYKDNYSTSSAGALGTVAGGAAGFAKGALVTGMLAKAGILTFATGGLAPFIGLAVGSVLGGHTGAILGTHGKDIAKAGAGAVKAGYNLAKYATLGTAKAVGYTAKSLSKFNQLSSKHVRLSHQFPQKLQDNLKANKAAEKKFKGMIKETRAELKENKNIGEKLDDLWQYRVPSQKAQQKLSNLTADYHIFKNAKANKGKLNIKQIEKEYQEFGKKHNWSKAKLKSELSSLNRRIEYHKDNLNIKENNEVNKSLLTKLSNSKPKVKEAEAKFNQKGNPEKKSISPTPGQNQDYNKQVSKEVQKEQQTFNQKAKETIEEKRVQRDNQPTQQPQQQSQQHFQESKENSERGR